MYVGLKTFFHGRKAVLAGLEPASKDSPSSFETAFQAPSG
jgi:hypothetical protein